MKINYNEVKTIVSFRGVKIRGDETFDELVKIEQDHQERIRETNASIQRVDAQTKINE